METQAIDGQLKPKNYTRRYVIITYLAFWLGIITVGAAYLLSPENALVMNWASAVASWTPTIVLMLMFGKLMPDIGRIEWIKEAFAERIKTGVLIVVTLVFVCSIGGTYAIMLLRNSALSISDLSGLTARSVISVSFFAIIQGATGEEAGWRGYLQRHFEQKSGGRVIKSALLIGLIWSFWHTPLWLSTGLPIEQLLIYIATFIIGNLCLSVIIAVCYSCCRNLFVPMWIHFLSNALSTIIEPYVGDIESALEARCWLGMFYVLAALLFILWHLKRTKKAVNCATALTE